MFNKYFSTVKILLLSLFLMGGFSVFSQDFNRDNIIGKIIVEGDDIEGITIYNTSSKKGAITDASGRFMISVALNDHLEIRALEYQSIDIKVNSDIISSKKMRVYLIEKMNVLDEVVITKTELSGSLTTDTNRVEKFNPKGDAFYFGITSNEIYLLNDDSDSQVRHLDKNEQGKTMVDGLNVINVVDQLLIPLFRSEVKNKKEVGVPEVPAEYVKYYFGSDYLVENFSIPEHRVEEFIRYVEDDTFNYDLLNYGHEIELLDLLSRRSKTFLESQTEF